MSLRHGLLGLLAEGPASGYDLTRRFQETLGVVWPARHPQIYAELGRLADDGLIEVDSHGPRGRKAYHITDVGLAEVRAWLAKGEVDRTMRNQSMLRSAFFWLLSPEDYDAHLRREIDYFSTTADAYRDLTTAKDRGDFGDSPHVRSLRIAAEAAVRVFDALTDWAEWARDHPPTADQSADAAPDTGAGTAAGADTGTGPSDAPRKPQPPTG